MRFRLWQTCVLLGAAALGLVGACQQDETAPPTVGSSGHPVSNGGGSDASSVDTSTPVTGSGVTTLASGVVSPQAIALGPTTVYWTTAQVASAGAPVGDAATGTGGIESVPRVGGARAEIIDGLASPGALALSSTTLFFAQGGAGSGTLDSFILGETTLSPIATRLTPPLSMIVDEGVLYWTAGTGTALVTDSVEVSGGKVSVVDSYAGAYDPVAITNVGTTLYILTKGAGGASILELPTSGGTPKAIWKDATVTPSDLAVGGTTLYWLVNGTVDGGELLATPTSGGTIVTLASSLENPAQLAVLGDEVYLTSDVASGSVLEVSTGGGGITTLAAGLDYPFALAVDDAVYFTTASTVGRVPR
jgi:hypothetical protein